MRTVQIICPVCRELVEIREKAVVEHGDCPMSGMQYIPSPRGANGAGVPSGPKVEIVGMRPVGRHCEKCGLPAEVEILASVKTPNPNLN